MTFITQFLLLEGRHTKTKGEIDIHVLVYSPNTCQDQGWARPNLGNRDLIWVLHVEGRDPKTCASYCFQGAMTLKLQVELGFELRHSNKWCTCPRRLFNRDLFIWQSYRGAQIFHLLVQPPHGCNGQDWVRLYPGVSSRSPNGQQVTSSTVFFRQSARK